MREGVRESERDSTSLRERVRYCLCERKDERDRKGEREIQSYIHSME